MRTRKPVWPRATCVNWDPQGIHTTRKVGAGAEPATGAQAHFAGRLRDRFIYREPSPLTMDPRRTDNDVPSDQSEEPDAAALGAPVPHVHPDSDGPGRGVPHPAAAKIAHPAPASPSAGLWTSLAAGFMLLAGLLHLLLVESHMAHARGIGLFFLTTGSVQILWAIIYQRLPHRRLGWFGLAALAIAPTILYVVTRIWTAPWSAGPEAVDMIGVVTQTAQVAAGIALWRDWGPELPSKEVTRAAVLGALIALVSYSGAMASENVEWLAEPVEAHGAHAENGHAGHGDAFVGIRGESIIGNTEYYGPPTGRGIDTQCRSVEQPHRDCWIFYLVAFLDAKGSVEAFDLLEELMLANSNANKTSHELAHVLGKHAYHAYGLDIELTITECSYDVFQGCLHGALQAYFSDLASQGKRITSSSLEKACASSTTRFEIYACLHGVGHGVMMYTNYALHDSLDLCAVLDTQYARSSCWGGVFMENVVAYKDSLKPGHVPHAHGNGEPPTYWVDKDVPAFPCNVVKDKYAGDCWRMQTSLILHFNGGDFQAAALACDGAGEERLNCYSSLGRDAAPFGNREPARMLAYCTYGEADARMVCVESFVSGSILQENTPDAAFQLCPALPEEYQDACYGQAGRHAGNMFSSDDAAAFCARVPEAYRPSCDAART